jgi:hypothetical protein
LVFDHQDRAVHTSPFVDRLAPTAEEPSLWRGEMPTATSDLH